MPKLPKHSLVLPVAVAAAPVRESAVTAHMDASPVKRCGIFFAVVMSLLVPSWDLPAADPGGAGTQNYLSIASRDEIIARAKEEGVLRGILGFEAGSIKAIKEGFVKQYPFIKTDLSEISGTAAQQRLLLELKGGRSDWDIAFVSPDFHSEYLPSLERLDLKRMAENGPLQIRPQMSDPKGRNTLAASSMMGVAAFNKTPSRQPGPQELERFSQAGIQRPEIRGEHQSPGSSRACACDGARVGDEFCPEC